MVALAAIDIEIADLCPGAPVPTPDEEHFSCLLCDLRCVVLFDEMHEELCLLVTFSLLVKFDWVHVSLGGNVVLAFHAVAVPQASELLVVPDSLAVVTLQFLVFPSLDQLL